MTWATDMQWFVLPINPEAWRVPPMTAARGKGGGVYVKAGRDQQLHNYQEAIRDELKRQRAELHLLELDYDGYELVFYFHHVLEQYQSMKGRTVTDHKADLTNLVKATEDALQGILIDNDTNVVKQTNYLQRSQMPAGLEPVPYVVIGVGRYLGHNPNELPAEVWEGVDLMVAEHRNTPNLAVAKLPEQDVF